MSGRGRSGVWDLEQRQRILHLQPLRTAWLGEPGALTAVVRERDRDAHSIVRFDLQKVPTVKAREVGGAGWWLHGGRVVLAGRPANPERPGRDVMLEARDVTTDKVLWSRRFAREAPHRQVNQDTGMLVLVWPLDDGDALKELKRDAAWQEVLRRVENRRRTIGFEVIDATTGVVQGRVAVDTRRTSVMFTRALATGDRLFVLEGRGRLVAYSFDGAVRGRMFAAAVTVSPDGRRLAVQTAPGRLDVRDARTLESVRELQFAERVALVSFAGGADRLMVLTADQMLHTFQFGT